MKTINLGRGFAALVDDEDEGLVTGYKWHAVLSSRGHAYAAAKPKDSASILMHRLILGLGHGRSTVVDHINGNGLDNRRDNIRPCRWSMNLANMRNIRKHSSRFKGVSLYRKTGRWQAQIRLDGRNRRIGLFASELDAAHAYDREAKILFGEFAATNHELLGV